MEMKTERDSLTDGSYELVVWWEMEVDGPVHYRLLRSGWIVVLLAQVE